ARRLVPALAVAALVTGLAVTDQGIRTGINTLSLVAGVHGDDALLPPLQQRSVVYAADGSTLAVLHDGQNRTAVGLADISPTLVTAVLDTEDANFWHHGGVDVRGVVRAARSHLPAGTTVQR